MYYKHYRLGFAYNFFTPSCERNTTAISFVPLSHLLYDAIFNGTISHVIASVEVLLYNNDCDKSYPSNAV